MQTPVPPLIPSSVNMKDALISTLKVDNLIGGKIVETGVATIPASDSSIVVQSTVVLTNSLIFLSPITQVETTYSSWWSSDIVNETSFTIHIDDNANNDAIFNYMIFN